MISYYPSILGAVCLTLLRFFDETSILSITLVITGVTLLLYGVRHATNKNDYIFIASLFVVAYIVRFYDYTESHLLDIVLGSGIGFVMFVIMAFERLFKRYENDIWYILIYPSIYLLFMYFTEIVKINLPFRLDTYFSCLTLLCQITRIFGTYILDFLLALLASVVIYVVDHKSSKHSKTILIFYITLMLLITGFGYVNLNKVNKLESLKKETIRIACATGPNNYAYSENTTYPTIDESINILTNIVNNAKKENTEILLFCEEAFGVNDIQEDQLLNAAQALAKENTICILLAYEVVDSDGDNNGKGENKLCFIKNNGEIIYEYTKYCIIPFIETADYVKGNKNTESFEININNKQINVACAICYDTDYDSFMSTIDEDTDLLLVPTWDWDVVSEEHFSVSCLRAISNSVTLVRSTYDGYSAVINSAGNILYKNSTVDSDYTNLLIYDVPIN